MIDDALPFTARNYIISPLSGVVCKPWYSVARYNLAFTTTRIPKKKTRNRRCKYMASTRVMTDFNDHAMRAATPGTASENATGVETATDASPVIEDPGTSSVDDAMLRRIDDAGKIAGRAVDAAVAEIETDGCFESSAVLVNTSTFPIEVARVHGPALSPGIWDKVKSARDSAANEPITARETDTGSTTDGASHPSVVAVNYVVVIVVNGSTCQVTLVPSGYNNAL